MNALTLRRLAVCTLACIIVAGGAVLGGCSQAPATPSVAPVAAPTAKPKTEGFVSAEAAIAPQKETTLSFEASGRVAEVLVTEGDVVTAGQRLAILDTSDLEMMVRQQEAALAQARSQLARAEAGPRPEDIAPYEAAVKIAETNVASAEQAIAVRETAAGAARAAVSGAQARLRKVLAGPTERDIRIAQQRVEIARNELWSLQKQRDAKLNIIEGQLAAAENAVQIAEIELEQLKAGARPEDVAIARNEVTQAAASVTTAEAQIEQARAQAETARAELAQAQAQLELARLGARPEDVAVARAGVTLAEVAVSAAQNALADAVLTAPFAGTVGAVLIEQGELVSAQIPAIRLGDLARLHAATEDLSEVDVSQVEVGQPARVTVDALEGAVFNGRVLRIIPVAGERRGDKVYTVLVELDGGPETGLRWGMSALVEIETRPRAQ